MYLIESFFHGNRPSASANIKQFYIFSFPFLKKALFVSILLKMVQKFRFWEVIIRLIPYNFRKKVVL